MGITLVVEPTAADSNLVESADDALMMSEESGMDNVKLMFDTYHAIYRNEVPSDYVYRMADKLHHVHLSDNDRLPPGQGTCNFESVFQALKEVDYQGYLSMEVGFDSRSVDPDWYARESISYLRELIRKIDWQPSVR